MTHARIGKKIPPRFSMDLDLPIDAGVTALYGPPLAGKTLLFEAIAGFVRPDSGHILIDDVIMYDGAARVWAPPRARRCGYVPQRDSLFPHMTVRQNLLFASHGHPRLERNRRSAEFLERLGLAPQGNSRPIELDPALQLRASVARALLASPKLLLIDERGVDEPLLLTIRELFSGPILLVSNNLDFCCAAVDRLVLLENGRILQTGAPRAVVDRPESVEAARMLGFPNIFEAEIAALDPSRHSSRLEFESFALSGPYIPGHFRGSRVFIAVHPSDLRVRSADDDRQLNAVPVSLVRASRGARLVRLEFSGGIFADLTHEEFERQKDNRSWQVEFPPQALRVL